MRRLAPRLLGHALAPLAGHSAPATTLARVQACWSPALGPQVAEQAWPASERGGVVTASCASAAWAQELDLMSLELVERLNRELARPGDEHPVQRLRFDARGLVGK